MYSMYEETFFSLLTEVIVAIQLLLLLFVQLILYKGTPHIDKSTSLIKGKLIVVVIGLMLP